METDNGPPFNSRDFEEFSKEEGFQHHRITPLHPRANGEAERFMQTLNKTEQIVHLEGKTKSDRNNAVQDMLTAYRSTPHPATGVTPYQAMRGATVRTKLDHTQPKERKSEEDENINHADDQYKAKMKQKREGRNTRETQLILGDYVLVKQSKTNKWSTPYEPVFYTVINIQGSQVTARRVTDGRTVCRDASHFKIVNAIMNTATEHRNKNTEPERRAYTFAEATQDMEEKQAVESNPQNIHERNEETSEVKQTPDNKADAQEAEIQQPSIAVEEQRQMQVETSRPRRERRKPSYLQDYVEH